MSKTISGHAMLEVRVQCPPVLASYLEELLWTVDGVESVTEHYRSNSKNDQTQPSDLTAISILTKNPLGEDLVKVLLVENPKLLKVCDVMTSRWIEEKDWQENWKQYWHPTPVTDHLTICPTWEEYTPKSEGEVVLNLDPECAFGTGTHETTQLMLKALEKLADEIDFSKINLLDVGTGSGILAIYAAKRGCKDVRALDNDPLAVETSVRNAALNDVQSVTDFTDSPLADFCHTKYDVIVANIIAPVILELFEEIMLRLKPGGYFLASGLIESSVGRVEERMKASGFTHIERTQQGDWYGLTGIAKG